ncbi:MAG TPA: sugar ABC transporter ATP-binding protein, partial [Verrucomicrobiae bacterium]
MPEPAPPLLEVRNVSKRFLGVRALHDVGLRLLRGEVLAVVGENGAGKSTLMKILAGVQHPDSGVMLLDGSPVEFRSVREAMRHGIALIHQELNLSENLDIGANVFLGREPRRYGLLDHRRIHTEAQPYLDRLGLRVSSRQLVGDLSIGRQQMVEIAKALSLHARVLIMDEPTSSLTQHETANLFRVIKELRAQGVSIIYISHRLAEIAEVADRVVVLRDGQNAGELKRAELDIDRVVRMMVGRDLSQFYQRRPRTIGQPLLVVENLRTPVHPTYALNFEVRAGEIVGLAGLVGSGRTELLRTLFGIDSAKAGRITIDGQERKLHSPIEAIAAGIALVPEDRKQQGLILEMAVRHNLSLASLRREQIAFGFLNRAEEKKLAQEMISKLSIKTPSADQLVQFLSGGNQQKVVIGKWLALKPRVLLLDEPTRGVDVGAKQEIYRLMEELAEAGVAILFVSSEMTEIIGMS